MDRLEPWKVKSFISFCNKFFLICFTKENIHDKNREAKCLLNVYCQKMCLETQSKVYCGAFFAKLVNDF